MKLQVKFKTPDFADCSIEITAKGFLAASVFWADGNGPLEGWSPLAVFPIEPSGRGRYRFDGHRAIPQEATHIYAKLISSDFTEIQEAIVEIPQQFLPQKISSRVLEDFTLMSDLHLTAKSGRIARGLHIAKSVILIPGDLTNDGYGEQFALFRNCIEENVPDKLVFSVTGNHDQRIKPAADEMGYAEFQQGILHRAENMGVKICRGEFGTYSARLGNTDIIGLQCVTSGRKFGMAEEQLAWLEEQLQNSDSTWHIVLCHAPLLEHNPHRKDGSAYYNGNNELQRIVALYPHIIFISGHTHFSPNTKQGNVEYVPETQSIYIDDGSVVPTELSGEPLMPSEWHDGVVSRLSIYEDSIEITYQSIHTGKKFPRGYYRFRFGKEQ